MLLYAGVKYGILNHDLLYLFLETDRLSLHFTLLRTVICQEYGLPQEDAP